MLCSRIYAWSLGLEGTANDEPAVRNARGLGGLVPGLLPRRHHDAGCPNLRIARNDAAGAGVPWANGGVRDGTRRGPAGDSYSW